MLPQILLILGVLATLCGLISPLFIVAGVVLMLIGGILWRQIYNRGNILYWQWMRLNQQWQIASEKRMTILTRIANHIDQYSGYEGNLLQRLSGDRSAANFLMQSFPNIMTMANIQGLYQNIIGIETEINQLRQEASLWNKEVQQMGTDAWFNQCLPGYLKPLLRPNLLTPEGDLAPPTDPGLANINARSW